MTKNIFYDPKHLYFEFGDFTLEDDDVGLFFLSTNTAMLAIALIAHYGKWRNRYTYNLSAQEKPRLNDTDFDKVTEIVDLALHELTMDATEYLAKMAKSLEEIEFTMKGNRANTTTDKVVKWFISKPPTPTTASPNPSFTSDVQGVHEYKTTTGALMGMGEIMGTALLDDLDINPFPNIFGQESKLDKLNSRAETIAYTATSTLNWLKGDWFDLMSYFAASFREGTWSNLNWLSQKTFFKMTQDSLNDTSALFGADKPYLNLIVENLIEKRFYLARFYALITNNKIIKWTGLKPATPGTFSPNPTLTQSDTLELEMPQEVIDIRDRINDIAGNSNEINHSLSESHWTFKHILARISKSGQIANEMPKPLIGEAGISTNDSVFVTRQLDDSKVTLSESLITAFLLSNGQASYIALMKDELIAIATTLGSPIRDLLEYIGQGLNLNAFGSPAVTGIPHLIRSAWFQGGDIQIRDGNSFFDQIAKKVLSVTVNPRVTADVNLNESGLTVINQVVPATVTVQNNVPMPTIHNELKQVINVDACCDDGTSNTPTDPVDPTDPNSPDQSPYSPIIPPKLVPIIVQPDNHNELEILKVAQRNGACGYYYYRSRQGMAFLIAIDELLDPITQLVTAYGPKWAANYLKESFPKKEIFAGVYLEKMSTTVLEKVLLLAGVVFELAISLNLALDYVVERMGIMGEQLACSITDNLTEDTVMDGNFFYSSWANKLISGGFEPTLARAIGNFLRDYVNWGGYEAGHSLEANFADFVQYCPCLETPELNNPCDMASNQLINEIPDGFFASSPFRGTDGLISWVDNANGASVHVLRVEGNVICVTQYFTKVTIEDPFTTTGYTEIPIENIVGVSDVWIKRLNIRTFEYGPSNADIVWIDHSVLPGEYTPFTDLGAITLPNGERRLGQWTWEKGTILDGSVSKDCIIVKGFLGVKAPTGEPVHSVLNNSPRTIDSNDLIYLDVISIAIKVYYEDGTTPPSNNSPFNVTPSGNNYTANWANVVVPNGASVTLKANDVTMPYTGNNVTGQFDPTQGVTLVLLVSQNNANGSVTTTTYTQVINPIVAPKSFSVSLERTDAWYYYLDLSESGIDEGDSYMLLVNGYLADSATYGALPTQLSEYVGLLTFQLTVTKVNGAVYGLSKEVDKPAYDPCNGQPVSLGDIIITRQAHSEIVNVSFTIDPNVDTMEIYNDNSLVAINSNNVNTGLSRGYEHVIKAVVHRYGSLECKAEKTVTYNMPILQYMYMVTGKRQYDLVNPIAKGIVLQKQPVTVNAGMYWYLPLFNGAIIALSEQNQYGEWISILDIEFLARPNDVDDDLLASAGSEDYALTLMYQGTGATANPVLPSGDIWLKLKEYQGMPVGIATPLQIVTDLQGLYRRVIGTGSQWVSHTLPLPNHPDMYYYDTPLSGNYMSFQFNTDKAVLSVLCGVFSLNNWSLVTTFYLQDLRSMRVGNAVVVGGYKFSGITLSADCTVTVIEVGLV